MAEPPETGPLADPPLAVPPAKGGSPLRLFALVSLAVAAATLFAFDRHRRFLLPGLDGAFLYTIIRQQAEWMPWGLGLGYNPFQGMADLFFPQNTRLVPVFLLQTLALNGRIDHLATFVLCSLEIFWSTYLLLRDVFAAQRGMALAAGAGTLAAIFPLVGRPWLWPDFLLVPHFTSLLSASYLSLACLNMVGRSRLPVSLGAAAGAVLLAVHASLAFPAAVSLVALAGAIGVVLIAAAETPGERIAKAATAGGTLLVLFLLGLPQFSLRLAGYTAGVLFPGEMTKFMTGPFWASILFHARDYGWYSPLLVAAGILGAWRAGQEAQGRLRRLHRGLLAVMGLFLAGAIYLATLADWYKGPAPIYFEHLLWPLYTYYALTLALGGVRAAAARLQRLPAAARLQARAADLGPIRLGGLAALAFLLWHLAHTVKDPDQLFPLRTPIVDEAVRALRLRPGDPFRGSVATLTALGGQESVNWAQQHTYDYYYLKLSVGNDHRMVGFWHFDVPTLFQYSPFISPFFHLATTRMLARPADWQTRNVLVLTTPHVPFLEAMGVRLLVSDAAIPGLGPPRRVQYWSAAKQSGRIHLYDLPGANLGQYSPTRVTEIADGAEALRRLRGPLDFTREVIVERGERIPEALVPAAGGRMRFFPGRIRVQGSSPGASLLLLPLQFSHCLRLEAAPPGTRLLRANLVETAVLFQGELDLTLRPWISPFSGGACRGQDLRDAERLRLREAARAFPLRGGHVQYD